LLFTREWTKTRCALSYLLIHQLAPKFVTGTVNKKQINGFCNVVNKSE